MKFRVEHTFRGITLADYEQLYFNEEFNNALCVSVKLDRTLEHREESDGKIKRSVRVGPDRELPAPVAKVIGAKRIEYTEHLEYTFGSFEGTWMTVSAIMTDKVDTHGRFGFEELPDGVLRWVEGEIKVKIFGVGKIVERVVVADIEKSYEKAAGFTQKWIDNGGKA